MPKIKTRKAIEESMRQVQRLKHTPQEETTPESSATQKLENKAKHTAYDTSRFLGHKAQNYIHNAHKKHKAEKAKQSAKTAQRTAQISKAIGKAAITVAKASAKAVAVIGKAIASAIASGGWIAVVIVLVVCLIVFLGAFLVSGGDNSMVSVALSQVGNIGGEPYWSWYGYETRVEWCACFVSWCANECGYIDNGIIPKFAGCVNGVQWFKDRGQWADNSAQPTPGMIIFFDWDSPNGASGPQDGLSDHVGIVEKVENGRVYTIEGNTSDSCNRRDYPLGYYEILGYGIPAY